MHKLRIAIGLVILVVSLVLLAWGLWPAPHEQHSLRISPAEMSLPTPSSFVPSVIIGG